MKTWVVLLRGINVGGHHIVPMKVLRQLMEEKGFMNISTYIQSGNVTCQYPTKPVSEIGELIETKFGFNPTSFVLSAEDLQQAADNSPYPKDGGKTVHFFFFHEEPKNVDFELLDSFKAESESFQLIGSVLYLYAPEGIGRSKLAEKIPKAFGKVEMTARNLNTVNKLLEMVG